MGRGEKSNCTPTNKASLMEGHDENDFPPRLYHYGITKVMLLTDIACATSVDMVLLEKYFYRHRYQLQDISALCNWYFSGHHDENCRAIQSHV